jgi:hypothetical protein
LIDKILSVFAQIRLQIAKSAILGNHQKFSYLNRKLNHLLQL